MTNIVYVDEHDRVVGAGSKEEARAQGIPHRVVRVLLFNSKGEVLLQKRALTIINNPGKWDQSVGGHVDEGEEYLNAAKREMAEEINLHTVALQEVGKFYTEEGGGEYILKRFNMLYTAKSDALVTPDLNEVEQIKWVTLDALAEWMANRPDDFTKGFFKTWNFYKHHQ